jgi:hypothetical protein
VIVKGGSYGAQTITGGNGRTSACSFTVAPGEMVTLNGAIGFDRAEQVSVDGGGGINGVGARLKTAAMGAANVAVPNNQFAGNISGSRNVTLQGADFGGWLVIDSQNATVRNNDIGPCDSYDSRDFSGAYCDNGSVEYCEAAEIGCAGYNQGHLIEGNRIHDFGCDDSFYNGTGSDDCHWECMYVSYPKDLTIRGNTFVNCANGGNIFNTFSNGGGSFTADYGFTNYTIENNVFTQSCSNSSAPCGGRLDFAFGISGHCNIYSGADLTNVKIRNNTFLGGSGMDLSGGCTQGNPGVSISGNIRNGQSLACGTGWATPPAISRETFYNGGATCGAGSQNLGSSAAALDPFVITNSNAAPDAHLKGATGALDGSVPTTMGCPASDVDAQSRPTTGGCDAGADER